MRKINLLIPHLVVYLLPFITLSNCSSEPEPEEATFNIAKTDMTNERHGQVILDWSPSGNEVDISDVTFTYNNGTSADVGEIIQSQPMTIPLTFSEDIDEDITDGILSFYCIDSTAKVQSDKTIDNITITRFGRTTFTYDHTTMESEQSGSIVLNYLPAGDKIRIDGTPTLTYHNREGKKLTATVSVETISEGQILLSVSFEETVTDSITDGVLTFNYVNEDIGFSDTCILNNIAFEALPVDFSTTGWSRVIQPCNDFENGIINEEQFCKKFYFTDSQGQKVYPTSFDDFIGQTKRVRINGKWHDTIVIDYNKDHISNTNKNAALTFQFHNLISDTDGNAMTIKWDDTNNNYWDSPLCDFLNNDTEDETESVLELIKADTGNGNLGTSIKSINKEVNIKEAGSDVYTTSTRPTKLFEPTVNNIFSDVGIQNSSHPSFPNYLDDTHKQFLKCEGNQYKYYQNKIAYQAFYYDKRYSDLVIVDINKKCDDGYWLTSPSIYLSSYAWHILYSSEEPPIGYANQNYSNSKRSVAPCFCI